MHFKNQFPTISVLNKVLPIILASPILIADIVLRYYMLLIFGSSVLNIVYKQDTEQLLLQIKNYQSKPSCIHKTP